MRDATKPILTVGVPVFNGGRHLAEALQSLISQSLSNILILVSDNCSTDQTEEIARSFAARDPRVQYLRKEVNVGVAANHNGLLDLATTPYFRWAADDDICAPDLLKRCVDQLEQDRESILAYPLARLIDGNGETITDYEDQMNLRAPTPSQRFRHVVEQLRLCNPIYGVCRTEVFKRVRPLGAYPGSDYVFLAELSLHGHFSEVPERLFYRRMHSGASSSLDETEWGAFFLGDSGESTGFMRNWRHVWEYAKSVLGAPIDLVEKGRIIGFLMRKVIWSRRELAREFIAIPRRYFWPRANNRKTTTRSRD